MLVLVPAACGRRAAPNPLAWRELAGGLSYAEAQLRAGSDKQPVTLHLLRLEPRLWQLRVVTAATSGRPLAGPGEFRAAVPGAVAAVNAGFFDPEYRPLGLLVDRGETLAPLRHVDHGVFGIAAGQPLLRHAREWKDLPELEFAVECGPRLLVDGHPLTFKPGVARRTIIGHDRHGRAVLAVSDGVISLAELADFLGRSGERGGPGLSDALNLDGGPSTMLELAVGGVEVRVATPVQVPVGIVVVARQP